MTKHIIAVAQAQAQSPSPSPNPFGSITAVSEYLMCLISGNVAVSPVPFFVVLSSVAPAILKSFLWPCVCQTQTQIGIKNKSQLKLTQSSGGGGGGGTKNHRKSYVRFRPESKYRETSLEKQGDRAGKPFISAFATLSASASPALPDGM